MSNQTTTSANELDPPLTITIAGRAGSGKSTLAVFLAMCLEKAGMTNVLIDEDEAVHASMAETFPDRLKAIQETNPLIVINMDQLKRDKVQLILPGGGLLPSGGLNG